VTCTVTLNVLVLPSSDSSPVADRRGRRTCPWPAGVAVDPAEREGVEPLVALDPNRELDRLAELDHEREVWTSIANWLADRAGEVGRLVGLRQRLDLERAGAVHRAEQRLAELPKKSVRPTPARRSRRTPHVELADLARRQEERRSQPVVGRAALRDLIDGVRQLQLLGTAGNDSTLREPPPAVR